MVQLLALSSQSMLTTITMVKKMMVVVTVQQQNLGFGMKSIS